MTAFTREEKLQNVAFRLQREAYEKQVKAHKGKNLKQFIPCVRGLVFSGAVATEDVLSVVENKALYGTHCNCHTGLSLTDVISMEYDDSYRLRHYGQLENVK